MDQQDYILLAILFAIGVLIGFVITGTWFAMYLQGTVCIPEQEFEIWSDIIEPYRNIIEPFIK